MNQTSEIEFDGQRISVTISRKSGNIQELFLTTGRTTGYEYLCLDVAVIISIALQHGVPLTALKDAVGRRPREDSPFHSGSRAQTLIGAALDEAMKMEGKDEM